MLDADDDDDKNSAVVMAPTTSEDNSTPEQPNESRQTLKDKLKNIPDEGIEYSEVKLKEITKKFRSYETIKKEFDELQMDIKSDFQVMTELFDEYETMGKAYDQNRHGALFEDLEYLLHQIDNANDFVTAGGLERIILPNLGNQTNVELRIHSLKLLGTLVQNNPKGQIAAFERNVGSALIQLLSHASTTNTNELSSLLFAIGGLVRKFPLAQDKLLNNPGLKSVVDLLDKPVDYKVKMKSLLLITDLIREFDEVMASTDVDRATQYNATDIRGRLAATEYCGNVVELVAFHREDYLGSLYAADDILTILLMSKELCQQRWTGSSVFQRTLLAIKSSYDQQTNQRAFDAAELGGVIDKLDLLQTFFSVGASVKDEL